MKKEDLSLNLSFQGAMRYYDNCSDYEEKLARIVLHIYVGDYQDSIPAIIDTASPWCILNPSIFEIEEVKNCAVYPTDVNLLIRGERQKGKLYNLPIRLEALKGKSLDVPSVVFVPTLSKDDENTPTEIIEVCPCCHRETGRQYTEEVWNKPNFIGLDGFLNRIRFAIQPSENLFFFGEL